MTASDLIPITNRLDIQKASQDTSVDKTRSKGRGIAKVPVYLNSSVNATLTPEDILPGGPTFAETIRGFFVWQWNFEVEKDFKLLNPRVYYSLLQAGAIPRAAVCVRYRENTDVVRYEIPSYNIGLSGTQVFAGSFMPTPLYAGQLIKKNCVFELWALNSASSTLAFSPSEFQFQTNILREPTSVDEQYVIIPAAQSVSRFDLDATFDEPIPTEYGISSCWMDNVT